MCYLCPAITNNGLTGSIGILINYNFETEKAVLTMACRYAQGVGSDYRGRKGAQILSFQEFHHITGSAFFVA